MTTLSAFNHMMRNGVRCTIVPHIYTGDTAPIAAQMQALKIKQSQLVYLSNVWRIDSKGLAHSLGAGYTYITEAHTELTDVVCSGDLAGMVDAS